MVSTVFVVFLPLYFIPTPEVLIAVIISLKRIVLESTAFGDNTRLPFFGRKKRNVVYTYSYPHRWEIIRQSPGRFLRLY